MSTLSEVPLQPPTYIRLFPLPPSCFVISDKPFLLALIAVARSILWYGSSHLHFQHDSYTTSDTSETLADQTARWRTPTPLLRVIVVPRML